MRFCRCVLYVGNLRTFTIYTGGIIIPPDIVVDAYRFDSVYPSAQNSANGKNSGRDRLDQMMARMEEMNQKRIAEALEIEKKSLEKASA